MVDYKALTGLSLLQVPHFCARLGASLKDLNQDTTSTSKATIATDILQSFKMLVKIITIATVVKISYLLKMLNSLQMWI
jgi:hypothetical protein